MDYTKTDWNTFAASLPLLPDEVVRGTLQTAAQGTTLLETWEAAWKQTTAAMGISNDAMLRANKSTRDIMTAFFAAEAARRGLEI